MSLEDVEKIMAETQDSIEYQQVREYSTCSYFWYDVISCRKLMSYWDKDSQMKMKRL